MSAEQIPLPAEELYQLEADAPSPEVIRSYGVMMTPAIVVDRVLVHSGSIPDKKQIAGWLK